MRQINLINSNDNSTTVLQWDETTGELLGDAETLKTIYQAVGMCEKWGSIPRFNPPCCPDYPVTQPLRKSDEFALILATLDLYSDDLPLPEITPVDPYVRDQSGLIIGEIVF